MLLFLFLAAASAFGGSATWNLNANGSWVDPTNWTPATVPNGPADTATFGFSNAIYVVDDSYLYDVEVNGIVFDAGASAFTFFVFSSNSFDVILTISGVGITNNSGITQNFVVNQSDTKGVINFTNNATAGSLTAFTNTGNFYGGATNFFDTSSAGTGTFTNNGDGFGYYGYGGVTNFFGSATAANATLIANGGAGSGLGGITTFQNTSTAGNATLIANGGSGSGFGGKISFEGDSIGDTARVEVFGNGSLDISAHNAPGVTVGSIEGSGAVFLGANNLTVGSNNLSTTFSGVIQDSGSFTKIGTGQLVLSTLNTYTGGTTINRGKLLVQNRSGSGTGTGAVQVDVGTLGGNGTIAGAVTVGTGTGPAAVLSPGRTWGQSGTLTILSTLTFGSDATYKVALQNSIHQAKADEVIANGVTINSGAQFSFVDTGPGTLAVGTVFTVINNTSASPIAGTFSNLADGSVFTSNGNNFQASYAGGTGNDLTLTVVP